MPQIHIKLPENLKDADRFLFEHRVLYSVSSLKVKTHKNVFISHEGLCLKNLRLVKQSHFNLSGNIDKTFYYSFWRLALEQYIVSTFGRSLSKISLKEKSYLHIYTKWFNYFFWLTDCLPKLIGTRVDYKNTVLLYPEVWDKIPYVQQCLKFFPDLQIEKIPTGTHMQVGKLVLPETRQWSNAIDPKEIKKTREFIYEQLDYQKVTLSKGDKIFISRKKAGRRKPVNEEQLEKELETFGYTSVCMEEFSLLEQASIMRSALSVIGLHGAGLVNTLFMQKYGVLLELSPKVSVKKFRIPFSRIANAAGIKYLIQFCSTDSDEIEDPYERNVYVDIDELKRNLELMDGLVN